MNSMTGFGQSTFCHEQLEVTIEASSVNKRHLETVTSLPREWQSLEHSILKLARGKIRRGRLRIQARPEQTVTGNASINWTEAALALEIKSLAAFAAKHDIPFDPDASVLARLATTRQADSGLPSASAVETTLLSTTKAALDALIAMRSEEGSRLAEDLLKRLTILRNLTDEIETSSEGVAQEWREKLLERLRKAKLELDPDDERVLKEMTFFADKADVSEEITRLRSHYEQFRTSVESQEPVGRKLEFLLQEISRELNTLCAKSTRPDATRLGLEARNEVEKMREQALNIE